MNMQRIRALTVKELLRVLREPANLFMIIMLPLVMTLVFGIAFGGIGGGGDVQYGVAILDQDASSWSGELVSGLNGSCVLVPQYYEDDVSGQDACIEPGKGQCSPCYPEWIRCQR